MLRSKHMRKLIISLVVLTAVFALGFGFQIPAFALDAGNTPALASEDSPDILVSPAEGQPLTHELTARAQTSWPWYLTRAAGLVAAVSLVVLILSGVGLITGYTFRFLEPLTAWATHRAVGLVFAVSAGIHVIALLFDHFVPFTIAQVLFPFLSGYKPVVVFGVTFGSLWVAFGIFALYGTIAVVLSSLLWIDKKPYIWKALHFLSYLVITFVFFHALYLGTDLADGTLRVLWIVFGIAIALAILVRLQRRRSL